MKSAIRTPYKGPHAAPTSPQLTAYKRGDHTWQEEREEKRLAAKEARESFVQMLKDCPDLRSSMR